MSRSDIRCHADDAGSALLHHPEGVIVVAAEHLEAFRSARKDSLYLFTVARRLLYSDNIRYFRKSESCLCCHIGACASGNIVQHDRLVSRLCHCLEVLVLSLLSRLIVVRYDYQECVHTIRLEHLHTSDCVLERVCSSSHNYRNSLGMFLCDLEDPDSFLILKTRGLSCCSKWHEEVDSSLYLPVYQCSKSVIVHFTVLERSYQRCSTAGQIYIIHLVHQFSFKKRSLNSCTPVRFSTLRAASTAPAAKPLRENAS